MNKKIAVIFPGIGYHADKPLLYYGRDVAYECGYTDYINIKYTSQAKNIRGDKEKMKAAYEELYYQAKEQLKDINWKEYDDILFLSKSIGTIIATSYAANMGIQNVKHVLYTPLEYTFAYEIRQAIAFIGDNDPWSHLEDVKKLAEIKKVPLHIYKECNHSLESESTRYNLEILNQVMEETYAFCKE